MVLFIISRGSEMRSIFPANQGERDGFSSEEDGLVDLLGFFSESIEFANVA